LAHVTFRNYFELLLQLGTDANLCHCKGDDLGELGDASAAVSEAIGNGNICMNTPLTGVALEKFDKFRELVEKKRVLSPVVA